MSDQALQWYKNTMRLIEAAKGREEDEAVKILYQGWLEDIEKINESFPGIKERYDQHMAMYASFTPEQIDHICYMIGDWYCEWQRKMWVDGKPNQHWLGVAKEQLKAMICGD